MTDASADHDGSDILPYCVEAHPVGSSSLPDEADLLAAAAFADLGGGRFEEDAGAHRLRLPMERVWKVVEDQGITGLEESMRQGFEMLRQATADGRAPVRFHLVQGWSGKVLDRAGR